MKFIADVNIAQLIIRKLRQDGHDVTDIKKEDLAIRDTEIIKQALQDDQIILTHDRDFEGLTKYPKYQAGIIVIRLLKADAQYFYERLKEALDNKPEKDLLKTLTIITESGFEIYPYPKNPKP